MAESRKRSGCFKIGCFGCLLPVAVIIGLMVVLGVAQLARNSGDRQLENHELVRELPPPPDLEALRASGELDGRSLPLGEPRNLEAPEAGPKGGRVVLDLSYGEFRIRAGEPGEPIRTSADYESDAFRLDEEYSEEEDGRFTYSVRFKPRGGMPGMMFRGAGNNPHNRVEIVLPRDRPFDLEGRLGVGESRLELGGLWLRRVDLEAGTGEHVFEFEEPLLMPMSSFAVSMSVGELRILGLGYASPREVEVRQRLGELRLDLSGPWANDSRVVVDFGVGESQVEVGEGVRVEIERAAMGIGERSLRVDNDDVPEGAPTLTLDLRGKLGEFTVRR